MGCPTCGALNPKSAHFCIACGNNLDARCSQCDASSPAGARFCAMCGERLAENGDDRERRTHFATGMPAELAAKIRRAAVGERKPVTIVFVDVVGSTTVAERLDPEQWKNVMNGAFERLAQVVYRYEGTIAQFLGDGFLAFFGAPIAHEDDPIRAVRAGLDLVTVARAYSPAVRERYGVDFAVRVGVNTGEVVVGPVGTDLKYEYLAMGDAVNVAARLQSAASPMSVLVSDATFGHVERYVDASEMGMVRLRNRETGVRAYAVAKLRGGVEARQEPRLSSVMVGRDRELERLGEVTAAAHAGLGRFVVLIGEPGIGKSRLVAEWRSNAQARDGARWATGACLSYGATLAYHLVGDLVRSLIGARAATDDDDVRSSLAREVRSLIGAKAVEDETFLAALMSLPLPEEDVARLRTLVPQALRARYVSALRRLVRATAERAPLVVVLNDVHWADGSSVDLLGELLQLASEVPVVFCVVTRPDEASTGWRLVSSARQVAGAALVEIVLEPLATANALRMIASLLSVDAVPENVSTLVAARAEGNPLFIEELLRWLIERGAITASGGTWRWRGLGNEADIPHTLLALLLARIDRLPDDQKRALRVASVIGRRFSASLLKRVLEPVGAPR